MRLGKEEKFFNEKIYKDVLAVANDVFNKYAIEAGTYTLSECMDNNRKGMRCAKVLNYPSLPWMCGYKEPLRTVSVDKFSCEFSEPSVFRILSRFAKLAGVKEPTFTKAINNAPDCTFTMCLPRTAKNMAQFITKAGEHNPSLMYVSINVERSVLVASNTHVLNTMPVVIDNISGEIGKYPLYISPTVMRKISGECSMSVFYDNVRERANLEITDETGTKYSCEGVFTIYPNYLTSIPNVTLDGYVKFTDKSIRAMKKWLSAKAWTIDFRFMPGTNKVELSQSRDDIDICEKKIVVELENKTSLDGLIVHTSKNIRLIMSTGWDGGMWLNGSLGATIFDCEDSEVTLVMPCSFDGEKIEQPYAYGGVKAIYRDTLLPKCIQVTVKDNKEYKPQLCEAI